MKRVLVQYKVKADKADKAEENINFIKNVFKELKEKSPSGLKYVSFHQPDGVSFVHIASIETQDGKNPLSESAAFKEFQKEIKNRCEIPPVAVDLNEIDSYKFFGE
jgi:2,4-dienoyl-CoA reductase-like NADH-dependent reductase (Old Yellow Enzyme family)